MIGRVQANGQQSGRAQARGAARLPPARARTDARKPRAKRWLVAALIPCVCLCCRGENSSREQVQALLARISELDLHAPAVRRAQQIEALHALPLRDPALARVRDRCVQAHSGLLSAEREQAQARVRLQDQAARGGSDKAALQAIAASVAHAAATLQKAQGALGECQRSLRALVAGGGAG